MATGFDYLAQAGVQNAERQSQLRDEARIAQRDATAGLLMNSLNNPDLKPEDRATLIQQHNALYQPHEAPTLISRLSGLIHGQHSTATPAATQTQSAPGAQSAQTGDPSYTPPAGQVNELGAPLTSPTQTNELGAPLPPNQPATDETAHPFATTPHPLAQKAHDLIAGLQNHLAGFAHPTAPVTAPAESTADLIARTYASPEELKRKDADLAAQRALNLEAERRKRFLLTATPENKFLNQYAAEHGAVGMAEPGGVHTLPTVDLASGPFL